MADRVYTVYLTPNIITLRLVACTDCVAFNAIVFWEPRWVRPGLTLSSFGVMEIKAGTEYVQ